MSYNSFFSKKPVIGDIYIFTELGHLSYTAAKINGDNRWQSIWIYKGQSFFNKFVVMFAKGQLVLC